MRFCDAGERQESRSGESSALQFVQVWYTYPAPCARVVVPSTVQTCTSIWSLRLRTPYLASPYGSCYETLGPRADYHFRLEFNGDTVLHQYKYIQVKLRTYTEECPVQVQFDSTHMNTYSDSVPCSTTVPGLANLLEIVSVFHASHKNSSFQRTIRFFFVCSISVTWFFLSIWLVMIAVGVR